VTELARGAGISQSMMTRHIADLNKKIGTAKMAMTQLSRRMTQWPSYKAAAAYGERPAPRRTIVGWLNEVDAGPAFAATARPAADVATPTPQRQVSTRA